MTDSKSSVKRWTWNQDSKGRIVRRDGQYLITPPRDGDPTSYWKIERKGFWIFWVLVGYAANRNRALYVARMDHRGRLADTSVEATLSVDIK